MKRIDSDSSSATAENTDGFTLVELMVALAVLSVLLLVAAPSFQDLIKKNKLISESYALRATLNNARSEALAQRMPVIVCRSVTGDSCSNGAWNDGYIAFTDRNDNALPDDPNSPGGDLIFISRQTDSTVSIVYSGTTDSVRFDSRGYNRDSAETFTFCDDRGDLKARGLLVERSGSVKSAIDPTGADGVKQDHDGGDLDCTP